MTQRGGELLQYDFRWPAFDAAFAASLMRWAMLALIVVGTVWVIRRPFARWLAAGEGMTTGPSPDEVSGA